MSDPIPVEQAADAFNRACQLTGLSQAELARRLGADLGRPGPLSRQTLAAWRRGTQPVPLAAFLAATRIAGIKPPVVLALADGTFDPPAGRS